MHILILFSQPWRVGGAETHVESLIAGLHHDHKLTLVINQGGSSEKIAALSCQYPDLSLVEIQSRGFNLLRWFWDLLKLIALVKKEKVDIISAQQRTAGIWANIIRKKTGVPFVVTMHDSWHRALKNRKYVKIFKQMIVVNQNLTRRLIRDFGFASDAITLIHNGIDFHKFSPDDSLKNCGRVKFNIAENAKLILHVSRLSSVKGAVALTLLDSIPQLIANNINYQVVIIGEGPLRGEVEAKASLINVRYGPVVKVENFTSDLLTWYATADVIVGEGRVALEALACLKPVVAIRNNQTFLGAVSAQNIEDAVKVNFDGEDLTVDPQKLAEHIRTALVLPEAERLYILKYLQTKMSIAAMTEGYLGVFKTQVPERQNAKNAQYLAN